MNTNARDVFAVAYDHIGGYRLPSMRGLDARCLMAEASIAHFVGDQSCLVTAWEAELLAFVDGAISTDGDTDVPPLLADDPVLTDAWFRGRKERSNTEGFAHEGRWYWYCYCH